MRTKRDAISTAAIGLLAALWLVGTPALLMLAFKELLRVRYAVQFTHEEVDSLTEECAVAAAIIGIAAPATAAIIAGKTGRGGFAAVFGAGAMLCMVIVVVFVGGMQGSPKEANRIKSIHTEPPAVCTAQPERALEVPGC